MTENLCDTEIQSSENRSEEMRSSSASMIGIAALMVLALLVCSGNLFAQTPKQAPLMTRWAKGLDPSHPLPDYPRPQMQRKEWMNLNGVWEMQSGLPGDAVPAGKELKGRIIVPFPVESALSGVMLHFDRLWYRRTFTIPAAWTGRRILLNFGAVDYESEVYINGKSVGVHRGGYDPFSFDVTPYLNASGAQEIIVRVYDPTELGGQPRGKQTTNPGGIMYTPTTGIWQTVWLEPVASDSIRDLKIVPDIERSQLHLTVNTIGSAEAATVDISVRDGDRLIQKISGTSNTELNIPVPNPKLWSPDHPFLYGLEVSLNEHGHTEDDVSSYFGMRGIRIVTVGKFKRILLNNHPVFEIGPLDQGFWPDGIYTAPTDDALKNDIEMMKAFGYNMVRKHEKVEPARWYYWTDKLGLLVWQDMPSPDAYPWQSQSVPPVNKVEFESELRRMVESHWNSPSIIMWTIFNEAQGQFDTARLAGMVKALDPSRLVNEASGGDYTGAGDINDLHRYPEPGVRTPTPNQALVNGEYGGVGLLVPGHNWEGGRSGYTNVSTADDLLYAYAELAGRLKSLHDEKGLSAAVYTQLTDVMTEINGLMTYDRIAKVDPAKISQANHWTLPMPTYDVVTPASESAPQMWKYTFENPGVGWTSPQFDDEGWNDGRAGFGKMESLSNTPWSSSDIWLRRHFDPGRLTADQAANLVIRDFHTGEIEIFINGVKAYSQVYGGGSWEYRSITKQAKESVRANMDNVLAVHCQQAEGHPSVQFVDVGLSIRVPHDK